MSVKLTIREKINSLIFMALDMIEATSGMGMHVKDIPPEILRRQMKVRYNITHHCS